MNTAVSEGDTCLADKLAQEQVAANSCQLAFVTSPH